MRRGTRSGRVILKFLVFTLLGSLLVALATFLRFLFKTLRMPTSVVRYKPGEVTLPSDRQGLVVETENVQTVEDVQETVVEDRSKVDIVTEPTTEEPVEEMISANENRLEGQQEEFQEAPLKEEERVSVAEESVGAGDASQREAYCVRCRQKRSIHGAKLVVTKNGRRAIEGKCVVCGTKLYRFIGKGK